MAIAFLSLPKLFASLQAFVDRLLGDDPAPVIRTSVRPRSMAPVQAPAKPLRVVRVLEPSVPRQVAGRMVISGRLADVCAELDRLAALEAA
jgi:hypothetical protein